MRPPTTLLVDEYDTWGSDRRVWRTPDNFAARGLGGFLDRVAGLLTARGPAVVMLDGQAAAMLGFPGTEPPAEPGDAYPSAERHHWYLTLDDDGRERRWATASYKPGGRGTRAQRVVQLGVLPWIVELEEFPFSLDNREETMWYLDRFEALTGTPFYGAGGGAAGVGLLRDTFVTPRTKDENKPRWVPDNWHLCAPATSTNTESTDRWKSGVPSAHKWAHEYDLSLQYLGAEQLVRLAPGTLTQAGPVTATTANPAGYYRIVIPKMHDLNGLLPHPAGSRRKAGSERWVTHATLDLLVECAGHGLLDVPEVLSRWVSMKSPGVAHHGTRIMRKWGDQMMSAIEAAHALKTVRPETEVLFDSLKDVYARARGIMQRPGGRIWRPDWGHAIIGTARANLWRRLFAEGMTSGRWPAAVSADQAWYTSDNPDARAPESWPETFGDEGDGSRPGKWRYKGNTVEVGE